ncbi:hypothetical protein GWN63_05885, partial [Candidatus Bathyarchaeota archaeon]|nr:hypothetical protein [Candidatus Bathyarchaeota archaeon]NIU81752.1 hypothetical protein [Candidatus Bathyarchaeota archaeon]NIV68384.1 hypothetical protein [Candidatus Bathyarchaeota archaeon]NIW34381.1 hypothetical protein [Candidatus Bathyarchaeota archaeon]
MSLRSFLSKMEEGGEVVHIGDSISPRFEASSLIKSFDNGPILQFDNVEGYPTKIVANLGATRERICSALNVRPELLYNRLVEAWRSPIPPKVARDGPVKEVFEKPDLSK